MPAPLLIAFIGVALLAVLVPVAIHQRRALAPTVVTDAVTTAVQVPTVARDLPMPYSPATRQQPISVARIAVGVFLGMWMFTITAAIIGGLLMLSTLKSLGGR